MSLQSFTKQWRTMPDPPVIKRHLRLDFWQAHNTVNEKIELIDRFCQSMIAIRLSAFNRLKGSNKIHNVNSVHNTFRCSEENS